MTQSARDGESTPAPGQTANPDERSRSVAIVDDTRELVAIGRERPAAGGRRAVRRTRAGGGAAGRATARPAPTGFVIPEALMRQALEEVAQEAYAVMERARARIDEIAQRTRALLDDVVAAAPGAAGAGTHARDGGTRDDREHVGTVVLEAGPFTDLPRLLAFEAGLAAIPTIERILILSYAEHRVRFELLIDDPTPLAAQLRSRTGLVVDVLDAGPSSLRLEVARASSRPVAPA